MSNVSSASTPREIDEHLASLHQELASLKQRQASAVASIYHAAGARRSYHGRDLDYNMTFKEAMTKVSLITTNHDELGFRIREAATALDAYDKAVEAVASCAQVIERVNKLYTGWSRFFVVTSSQGHIHSSMHCQSCYDTTTFGWLPHLSGKSELEAVEACGPALCSVCFPSAPVEHQGGKISEADAAKLAAGHTMAELIAEREAAKQAKLDAKAEKARKAAVRAQKLMTKVEAFYEAHGGYDAVMAMDSVYNLTMSLQTTVGDVISDDHREFHGGHRYSKNPRGVIAEAA